jgi:hypothetical protein
MIKQFTVQVVDSPFLQQWQAKRIKPSHTRKGKARPLPTPWLQASGTGQRSGEQPGQATDALLLRGDATPTRKRRVNGPLRASFLLPSHIESKRKPRSDVESQSDQQWPPWRRRDHTNGRVTASLTCHGTRPQPPCFVGRLVLSPRRTPPLRRWMHLQPVAPLGWGLVPFTRAAGKLSGATTLPLRSEKPSARKVGGRNRPNPMRSWEGPHGWSQVLREA